ncbi:MAG TPA: histidine kinase N-terminal 7TM domain-containing protein [Caldisericia bacterium]|nr:histidine kinase N-terminal 7TM domain-containing protein [Caldisericia bacterium]
MNVIELIPFFSAIMFTACGLSLFLIFVIHPYRKYPGGSCIIFTLIALTLWAFFQGLELLPFEVSTKILLSQFSYLGIAPIAPLFFLFIYHYTQQQDWRSNPWGRYLLLLPLLMIIAVFSNSYHHLFWTDFSSIEGTSWALIKYHQGPLFWLNALYAYGCMILGIVLLLKQYALHGSLHKKRIFWLLIAMLFPWTGNIIYVFHLTPIQGIDFAPISFAITCLIFSLVFIKYQLLILKPIAFEYLFSSMKEGVLVFDLEDRLLLLNPVAEKLIQYQGELMGSSPKDLYFLGKSFHDLLSQVASTKIILSSMEESQKLWYEIEGLPLKNHRKEELGTLIQIRNISEIKLREEKVKNLQLRQQALLDNLPFMAWLKDPHGAYISVNKVFKDTFKLPYHQIIGKTDFELWSEDLAKRYTQDDQEVIQTGKQKTIEEQLDKNNALYWVETIKAPIFDENGKVEGTTGVARDITDKKNLDLIKDEFISMVAHELRTPLTSVNNSLKLVLDTAIGPLTPEQREVLEIGKRNANRLARFINDVLDFQKMKKASYEIRFEKASIEDCIKDTIETLSPLAESKGIQLITELDPAVPEIDMDKEKISRVLINIANNALKFTIKGSVTIKTRLLSSSKELEISIADTGIGIKKEDIHKLFSTFVQVAPPEFKTSGSSGLGLAISKEIVQGHRGKVFLESVWEQGTTFYVVLPLEQGKEKE